MTIPTMFAIKPDQLSNDSLVDLIRQSVRLLRNRGASQIAIETLAGELEDLHIERMDGDALENRAEALAQETGPLA